MLGLAGASFAFRPRAGAPPAPVEDASRVGVPARRTVVFTLSSRPTGAAVVGAGLSNITTPAEVEVPMGSVPIALRFEVEGYVPMVEEVVPDTNQRLRIQLSPGPTPQPAARDDAPSKSPARRAVRRRPRSRPAQPQAPRREIVIFED